MQHVVSQLIDKKRELKGKLNYHQGQLDELKKIIHGIEVSIKVFEPDFDPLKVKAKKYNPSRRHFENGEALLKILDFLRYKEDYVSTHDITVNLMESKNYDYTDRTLKNKIQRTVVQILRIQQNKGLIAVKEVSHKMLYWKIA